MNTIQLLAIAKTKDIKHYSMNTVLSPIVSDIAKNVLTGSLMLNQLMCTCKSIFTSIRN